MTSNYIVNLNPNNSFPVKTGYTFKNGDKGITFTATITELDTSGMTAKIVFHRSNGTSVEATLAGNGPTYTYTTLGNEFAVPGIVVADIKLYNGLDTQRVSTASFVFNVISDTMDGVGGGTDGYSDELEVLSQEFEDTLQEYKDAFGELLPVRPRGEWNSTTDYEILDLVSHNGSSYVCREDNKNVEPPNATKWQIFAEGYSGPIAASQVTYGNSNVGSALDNISDVISKNGVKNLLNNIYTSQSYHGMTITVSKGVMSFSGVASEETNLYVLDNDTSIESGQLRISGCPTGGGTTYYIAVLGNSKNTWISEDDGAGATFNYNKSTHTNLSVYIHIANGTDMTGKVFKPMITLASQPDSDYAHYVPYAMTNRELTEKANDLTRSYGSYSTNADIEDLIASNIGTMSNGGTRFIGINVSASGLKLSGGIWSGLICRGDASYYTCTFFGYNATITQYTYYNGTKTWSHYSRSSINHVITAPSTDTVLTLPLTVLQNLSFEYDGETLFGMVVWSGYDYYTFSVTRMNSDLYEVNISNAPTEYCYTVTSGAVTRAYYYNRTSLI